MSLLQRLRQSLRAPIDAQRWVVLDTETTGLDPRHDEVLCVSALAMHRQADHWSLVAQDSLDLVFRPREIRASEDNVLLHRLGWGTQSQGLPPAQALAHLRQWVGTSPVLAFHADFDRQFLRQACRRAQVEPMPWRWLDLADVLAVVFPHERASSLDAWMACLNVACQQRHVAAADVWSTAQLWLKAAHANPQHAPFGWRQWHRIARQVRWLPEARRM